ncbi:MAG: hypothetical protein C4547_09365 [Phycisphaerales bacterium]|nr:MAG: hypothetical protein C4547_09365 [Phycisphaerales bacterium]
MKSFFTLVAVAGFAVATAQATDVNIRVTDADGNKEINVDPGAVVNYKVTAVLSDQVNEGLALIGFDLDFDGGDLEQADTPSEDPMKNFVRNAGIDNPAGYGGTIIDGDLIQIGGGQNTIKNFVDPENPEFPVGTVITGVAWTDQVVVTGQLTAPDTEGTYTLAIENVFANVIRDGETGIDFWRTDPAEVGTVENLTIIVGGGGGCPNGAKIKGKFKKNDIKVKMKKHDPNTDYTVEARADGNPVASQAVTTNNKGKASLTFKDVECGPTYTVGVVECGSDQKVTKTCTP